MMINVSDGVNKLLLLLTALIYFAVSASSCSREVSVTPPDSPPPNGFIFINSNPWGFHIYLDNKERRRATPDSLTWLTTGTYLVTLKKDLFKDTSVTVGIVEGEKHSVFVDFTQNPSEKGYIYCTSYPSNSNIFLNDSNTGLQTPNTLTVMPGYYYVRYQIKNCRDDSVLITVSYGKTFSAKLSLVDTTIWQDYTTSNSGIPTTNLTCIVVEKNNIVWVGSLGRSYISFNGLTWKIYPNSLSNDINCIAVDANNTKYIGTSRGFILMNRDGVTTEYGFTNDYLPSQYISAMALDNNGNCYLATGSHITQFPDWVDYTPTSIYEDSLNEPVTGIAIDKSNNVWVGIRFSGLAVGNSSKLWRHFTSSSSNIISDNVTVLTVSPSGEIWAGFKRDVGSSIGLSYFNGSTWNSVYPIPMANRTNAIFIDKNNIKWVGTDQGLTKFSSASNAINYNYDNTGLDLTNVNGISQDSYGNIWITTTSGLFKYKGNH